MTILGNAASNQVNQSASQIVNDWVASQAPLHWPPPTPVDSAPGEPESSPILEPSPTWDSSGTSPAYVKKFKYSQPKLADSKEIFYNRVLLDLLKGYGINSKDGEIGIEIECEGTSLWDSPIQYWQANKDGSLRDRGKEHPPIEYTLKEPLPREKVEDALRYLNRQLIKAGSKVQESTRASVHVHINVQKMTLKEIFTFVSLYLLYENSLVEFSGPLRVGNLFCLRAKDAEYWIYCICRMFQTLGDLSGVCSNDFRYTSCNTASLTKFGSLEFRSMRGTVDKDLIQLWVEILLHLKDQSSQFTDPFQLYEQYSLQGPIGFTNSIFRTKPAIKQVLMTTSGNNFIAGVEEGSNFVRDIASCIPEWKAKKTREELKKLALEEKKKSDINTEPLHQRLLTSIQNHSYKVNHTLDVQAHYIYVSSNKKWLNIPGMSKGFFDQHGWIAIMRNSGNIEYLNGEEDA